ncbi:MAG: hypothetical protein D6808_00285, partial [Candidatus Dadabacteria bacterium]
MPDNYVTIKDIESLEEGISRLKHSGDGWGYTGMWRANQNTILIVPSTITQSEQDALLDSLCKVKPARYFVVELHPENTDLKFNVSARCHFISDEQKVCSDVIKISSVNTARVERTAGIIREHLVTGAHTDVVIANISSKLKGVLDPLILLGDRVIFDSTQINAIDIPLYLLRLAEEVIDLEWIRLSPWRGLIKNTFDIPAVLNSVNNISAIKIIEGVNHSHFPSLLIGGWILASLGLEATARTSGGFECIRHDGRIIKLEFISAPSKYSLTEVDFLFDSSAELNEIKISRKKAELCSIVA